MHTYYQPWLFPFLGWKRHKLPVGVKRYTYHSFEDGLWDLLTKRNIPKGSIILIPDFYCVDVLNNIESHGYRYMLYPLDTHFQIAEKKFRNYIHQYTPSVIMIFHACGIRSNLMKDTTWMNGIPANTIILEDAVHLLINPEEVKLLSDTHFIMDSARKVSPISGSNLYGTINGLTYVQNKTSRITLYALSTLFYYTLFRYVLMLSELFLLPTVAQFSYEKILKKHDDIIGDSMIPHSGTGWKTWLFDHFDFTKIQKRKREQVALYIKLLAPLFKKGLFYRVNIQPTDEGSLHVYPLGFSKKPNPLFEKALHDQDVVVWFKFPDAPWSKDKGILFLPVGFHIQEKDIERISAKLQQGAYTL